MIFDQVRNGGGTSEWAETTENIQRGCANDCLYCYAAHNAQRFGWRSRAEWPREELTAKAERIRYPKRKGVIMFPSAHDVTPFNVQAFIAAARQMLEAGNRLLLVSKPRMDCLGRMMKELYPWREQIQFRFTIGALDRKLVSLWEPGASHPLERLDCLAAAAIRGFSTSVSIEPMLAGVDETLRVVEAVRPWRPETVWIGKMNHIRRRVGSSNAEVLQAIAAVEELQQDREITRLVCLLDGVAEVRWKDSIKTIIGRVDVAGAV